MNIPQGLFFTKEHEWVKIEGNKATMGISDHAQSALGDITFIELPQVGKECKQFEQVATVESVKAASDVYSPLSGKIVKINEEIVNSPDIVNQSPYEKGWFAVIELKDKAETGSLLDAAAYRELLEGLH